MKKRHIIRVCVYIPLGVILAIQLPLLWATIGSFTPPDEHRRAKATGELAGVKPEWQSWFLESESFASMPPPGSSDWLNGPGKRDRMGQTYGKFRNGNRNAVTKTRRTLYILPFDQTESQGLSQTAKAMKLYLEAYFQLPVRVLPQLDPDQLDIHSRFDETMKQWLTTDILKAMKLRVPNDAYCVIALTLTDLYPKESWNFVFGQASLADRVGVLSLARYTPAFHGQAVLDDESAHVLFLQRVCKVLTHEIGHMFGAQHCVYYHCNLNGSNSLDETDRAPVHLCPVCLHKLYTAIEFDPSKRYAALGQFYEKHGLENEANWISRCMTQHLKSLPAQ